MLWLSTRKGLFRLDPVTGKTRHFYHDPGDPSSLGDNAIKSTGEDREGRFWVGTSQTLDEFDRNTGKVKRHVLTGESGIGLWFHEDRFGVFWIIYGPDGSIATFDPKTNKLTRYGLDSRWPREQLEEPGLRPAGGPRRHHVVWNGGPWIAQVRPRASAFHQLPPPSW